MDLNSTCLILENSYLSDDVFDEDGKSSFYTSNGIKKINILNHSFIKRAVCVTSNKIYLIRNKEFSYSNKTIILIPYKCFHACIIYLHLKKLDPNYVYDNIHDITVPIPKDINLYRHLNYRIENCIAPHEFEFYDDILEQNIKMILDAQSCISYSNSDLLF